MKRCMSSNKKSILWIMYFIFFFLLVVRVVNAWGPYTHGYVNKLLIEDDSYQGRIASIIRNNKEYYDACFIATDIVVWYYYTHFSKYEATHSWSFQEEFMKLASNDKELACGYGIAAHLIQDSISHNHFVPNKIRSHSVPNLPLHPIVEAGIEAHVLKNHPEVFERYRKALEVLLNDKQLLQKFDYAISKRGVVNTEELIRTLNDVMGNPNGFYSKYFMLPDIYYSFAKGNIYVSIFFMLVSVLILYFKILKEKKYYYLVILGFALFLSYFFFIGGLSALTNYQDAERYLKDSKELTKYILSESGWGSRYKYDPTGYGEIQQADKDIMLSYTLTIAIVIVLLISFIYFTRKRKRK